MNRVCYVCCVYFGDRRCTVEEYAKDRLAYVREHVKSLQECLHNLTQIVFVFNLEPEHLHLFEEAKKLIPRRIQRANVEIMQRENYGMSYGAWSDVYVKHQSEYDYYIFNEDDYFFVQDDFDKYLVEKFESYENIGYLCGAVMNPVHTCPWVTHAANSVGISSHTVLQEVYKKFGCLPHGRLKIDDLEQRYGTEEHVGQISQTNEIFKMGYNLYDIREDFCTPHDMGPYLKWKIPEFNHFVDNFFYWNRECLFVPAPIKFNHKVYFVDIIDGQYQRKRSCYVINFYFGPRRKTIEEYHEDPLCFLRKHIELLNTVPHNLDKVIFSINADPSHYNYVNEAIKITPKKIKNTEVEIVIRENKGLSYGAFSDAFAKNRENYDYFIFNEDDYFPVEKSWDEYLIRKYNSLPDSGYLCAIQRCEDFWNDFKVHAGHCFGIASTGALNAVWDIYGCLPHRRDTDDYYEQEKIQHEFGYAFTKAGLRVYDVREEYRVAFAMTPPAQQDIWHWFWWNEKDLIVPAIIAFGKPYVWWESSDGPCIRRTNLEKYEQKNTSI